MLTTFIALVALVVGAAAGWAMRGPRRWCPNCGGWMACTECPRAVAGRLPRTHASRGSDQ